MSRWPVVGGDDLTVVLADAQPAVRRDLRALLSAVDGMTVVAEAATGEEAVREVVSHRPDVLMLDLRLRGVNGVAVSREVVIAAPDTAVLVFTDCGDDDSLYAALSTGVRGYLLKGTEPQDIVRGVRAVAEGAAIFGADVAGRITGLLAAPRPRGPFSLSSLTAREREVLALLATGAGNTAVAQQLGVAPKTVRNLVSAIVVKLRVADRAEAIRRATDAGLVAAPAPRCVALR